MLVILFGLVLLALIAWGCVAVVRWINKDPWV